MRAKNISIELDASGELPEDFVNFLDEVMGMGKPPWYGNHSVSNRLCKNLSQKYGFVATFYSGFDHDLNVEVAHVFWRYSDSDPSHYEMIEEQNHGFSGGTDIRDIVIRLNDAMRSMRKDFFLEAGVPEELIDDVVMASLPDLDIETAQRGMGNDAS